MASNNTQITRLHAISVAQKALKSPTVTRQGMAIRNGGEYTVDELIEAASKVEAYLNA